MLWKQKTADDLNQQIKSELHASYVYLSLKEFFDRNDLSLENISNFFDAASKRKQTYATKMIEYQTVRGGQIELFDISAPKTLYYGSYTVLSAYNRALALEESIHKQLLEIHSNSNSDPAFQDFVIDFARENIDQIDNLKKLITNIKRCAGDGLGEFLFNKHAFV